MGDILKPGQINVQMNPVNVGFGDQLKLQVSTPEGSKLLIIIQPIDYNWKDNFVQLAIGQVDVLAEARKGNIMGTPPKGIIS